MCSTGFAAHHTDPLDNDAAPRVLPSKVGEIKFLRDFRHFSGLTRTSSRSPSSTPNEREVFACRSQSMNIILRPEGQSPLYYRHELYFLGPT